MLYQINKSNIEKSDRIRITHPDAIGLTEKDIENFLKTRLPEVVQEDHLMLIGQERSFQEEADLIAMDKNGCLYIFELKRWQSEPENLLQVMRYGQIFGRYNYKKLEDLSQRQMHHNESLAEIHQKHFDLDAPLPNSEFNNDQVFVLITNGLDNDTFSAVQYWKKKGVKIECAPYRIYEIDGKPYIQFDAYSPEYEVMAELNTKFFVVNTCESYRQGAWETMLNEGKASAYYNRKHSVTNIKEKDIVYLYQTGTGVIAKGQAIGDYKVTDCDGVTGKGEEFYIPLNFSVGWKLSAEVEWKAKAPKAWQINHELKSGHRFRQTVFGVSKEMAGCIDKIYDSNLTTNQ